jgi:hypothetical protein
VWINIIERGAILSRLFYNHARNTQRLNKIYRDVITIDTPIHICHTDSNRLYDTDKSRIRISSPHMANLPITPRNRI